MSSRTLFHVRLIACAGYLLAAASVNAQDTGAPRSLPPIPGASGYAPTMDSAPLADMLSEPLTVEAKLVTEGPEITRGLIWRVFDPEPGPDGKLPLRAQANGGTAQFTLPPGSYLIHAAFGRAGATKRVTLDGKARRETLVLEAGGLKLDAILPGGLSIDPARLTFEVHAGEEDTNGEKPLILPNVKPGAIVRLNAGLYHVVSTYGDVNAIVRADIRVEAGKLTEAVMQHNGAEVTLKLVRAPGGEALADTAWSLLTASGEVVMEAVGAYATRVLAAGDYTAIAKNRDRIFQHDFTVEAGAAQQVELVTTSADAAAAAAD